MCDAGSSTLKQAFTIHLVFAGDSACLPDARDAVMQFLAAHDISDEEEIDLLLALQEGLANAVFHGCGDNAAMKVECTVRIDPSEINIVIRDPGAGFDTSFGNSSRDGANFSQHGRGILLMRSLVDELTYCGGGSELHMKKLREAGGRS